MSNLAVDPQTTTRPVTTDLVVVGAAPLAALVTWLVWVPVAGVELTARSGSSTQTIGLAAILASAVLFSLLAWGVLRLFEARLRNGLRVWTWLAVVALVGSFFGPLGATTVEAGLALTCLHLAVGIVLIGGFRVRR